MSDNIDNKLNVCSKTEEKCEEQSVTLLDVLELQKELEEESAAVLGGSDEKECTYEKGYVKRQALYSCLTCCPEAKTNEFKTASAGICLACSYQCHENHELVELYTKRNFRCDCPTERIKHNRCTFKKLVSTENQQSNRSNNDDDDSDNKKLPENKENMYNQNFSGLYCICKRPYPDPDDSVQDEMIQCVICEDWYHTRHLDASSIPKSDSYSEMICGNCMEKYDFLKDYTGYAVNKLNNENDLVNENHTENDLNVMSEGEDDKLKSELDKSISDIMSISSSSKNSNEDNDKMNIVASGSNSIDDNDEPVNKKMKLNESTRTCKRPIGKCFYKKGAVFWIDDWRQNLCKCSTCLKMYCTLKIEFLLDKEDTVHFYEENGLKKVNESGDDNDKIARALSSMDRVTQIEAITEYNRMKNKLIEFLRTFAVNQKVVTEADIHGFFQEMKNEKNSNLGVPHFCR